RLWGYLTAQIFTSKEHGPKEKLLSQTEMARGSDDWLGCKRRSPDKPAEDLLICRESQGWLIDARFSFLPKEGGTSVTSPYMKYNSRRGRRGVCAIVRPPGNCSESTAIT